MSAASIMRRAIERVDAAAEADGPIVGCNGCAFTDMSRAEMLDMLHSQVQQIAYLKEFYALVAPHIGRGFGQLGEPTGHVPKPLPKELG